MRRIIHGIVLLLISLVSISYLENYSTKADSSVITVNDLISAYDNTIISDKEICISNNNLDYYFNIEPNVTLVINNCNITASVTDKINSVFNIASGGKLILNNVNFFDINYDKCITNEGKIEITNTNFVNNMISIYNNSEELDSIIYHSGNLAELELNKGYISVTEDTIITNKVKIILNSFNNRTLVVKGIGNNVFASKYIDKFEYVESNSSEDDEMLLDYIGDFDTEEIVIKDATNKVDLKSGDIILTETDIRFRDLSTRKYVYYAPTYCTSYNYLKTAKILYKSNLLNRTLDNYSACISSDVNFSNISSDGETIDLRVNIIKKNNESETKSLSYSTTYLTGSNTAIFVDIPEGYTYKGVEFVYNNNVTDLLSISENLYSNSKYMRAIINCNTPDYGAYIIYANFIFEESVNYATIEVKTNSESLSVTSDDNMIVGSEYEFKINKVDDELITDIYFNDNKVDFDVTNDCYTFSSVVLERNEIEILFKHIINVSPNPVKTNFVYGEVVELKEDLYIEKTNEIISIEYVVSGTNVGSYFINKIKSCNSENYIINVIANKEYFITPKIIDVRDIKTKTLTMIYSKNIDISYEMFLDENLPAYLIASIDFSKDDIVVGTQNLTINFNIISNNYTFIKENNEAINSIEVELIVTASSIETDSSIFNNASVIYTGEVVEIFVENYDANLINIKYFYYLENDLYNPVEAIDSGKYLVKAIFESKSDLYTIDKVMEATLTIIPKTIDMTDYIESIAIREINYDGNEHSFEISNCPENINYVISETDKYSNVGTYYYTINFSGKNDNYVPSVTSTISSLIINPKVVTLTFVNNLFNYTGVIPNIIVDVNGVVGSDDVEVIFDNNINYKAGEHKLYISKLTNDNYCLDKSYEFVYYIKSISVDLSGIEYKNIVAEYDGNCHKPVITGTLPIGIRAIIDKDVDCVNAGEYIVKCSFESIDDAILAPEPIYAKVTIKKRAIRVIYSEPSNMISNGERKVIKIELRNIVDGENLKYNVSYSGEPILAGKYSCKVILIDDDNYYIENDEPYEFIVFTRNATYTDNDISVNIEGKFVSSENVVVSKVEDDIHIVNLVTQLNAKSYKVYDFSCMSLSSEPMKVSVDSKYVVDKVKNLSIYRITSNGLEKIDFELNGEIITFSSNCNENIIFVESFNLAYYYLTHIIIISCLSVIAVVFIIVFLVKYRSVRKKK